MRKARPIYTTSNLTVFKEETQKDAKKEIGRRLSTVILAIIVVAVALSLVTAVYFANVSYSSEKSFSKTYLICKEKILGFERMGALIRQRNSKQLFLTVSKCAIPTSFVLLMEASENCK